MASKPGNSYIAQAIANAWSREGAGVKTALDLSCGGGLTTKILVGHGFRVVATNYGRVADMGPSVGRVSGVDLNTFLPFKDRSFDAVNLTEVIEHIENQPQLIREIARVLKDRGEVVISTPNVLNVLSRLRFLFTGFVRGRVRPLHYRFGPGNAHNAYMINFYELYYLLFHAGFEVEKIGKTRVKSAPVIFVGPLYPLMWICTFFAVIRAEKDRVQRKINWQIVKHLFSPALLFSDNMVVKARLNSARKPQV